MIDQQQQPRRNKPGRRPSPQPPVDAAACRALIAQEVTRQKPSESHLRMWYRLARSYEQAAASVVEAKRVAALEATAKAKAELVAIKSAEYRRRMAIGTLGATVMEQQRNALRLKDERIAELEARLEEVLAGRTIEPTPTRKDGLC
jgi:hypothetical protein